MHKLFEICSITLFLCTFCAFLWLKNPRNPCNPWFMNYLYAFGISTTVEDSLQIHLFMQNEPKFRKSQMNVTNLLTREYEKRTLGQLGKTNPKRTQSKPI